LFYIPPLVAKLFDVGGRMEGHTSRT